MSEEVMQRLRAASTRHRDADDIAQQQNYEPPWPPVSDAVTATGDDEADVLAELNELMRRLENPPQRPHWFHLTHSPHYAVVCFLDRFDKEWLLGSLRLLQIADKYIGADEWQYALGNLADQGPAAFSSPRPTPPDFSRKADGTARDEKEQRFKLQAWQAKQRMEATLDTEFWFALCFPAPEARDAWTRAHPPVAGTPYHDGYHVAEQIGLPVPR